MVVTFDDNYEIAATSLQNLKVRYFITSITFEGYDRQLFEGDHTEIPIPVNG